MIGSTDESVFFVADLMPNIINSMFTVLIPSVGKMIELIDRSEAY